MVFLKTKPAKPLLRAAAYQNLSLQHRFGKAAARFLPLLLFLMNSETGDFANIERFETGDFASILAFEFGDFADCR